MVMGFDNTKSADEVVGFLREQEQKLRERTNEKKLASDQRIGAFLKLFEQMGFNPKKFLPTHAAMTKRVVSGSSLPNISPAVNLHNAMILKWLVPQKYHYNYYSLIVCRVIV